MSSSNPVFFFFFYSCILGSLGALPPLTKPLRPSDEHKPRGSSRCLSSLDRLMAAWAIGSRCRQNPGAESCGQWMQQQDLWARTHGVPMESSYSEEDRAALAIFNKKKKIEPLQPL